ncbi:uncharacterized protein LOC104875853 [Fukomys damarensis]|uniref:uncharacterized protein LOC104875853 n=1 Tax=Fukomys damarensis TaxID=885580 RepID=UPI0005403384|nr:uncharacterized protein LOC104875853 [Fukomys damarensis]
MYQLSLIFDSKVRAPLPPPKNLLSGSFWSPPPRGACSSRHVGSRVLGLASSTVGSCASDGRLVGSHAGPARSWQRLHQGMESTAVDLVSTGTWVCAHRSHCQCVRLGHCPSAHVGAPMSPKHLSYRSSSLSLSNCGRLLLDTQNYETAVFNPPLSKNQGNCEWALFKDLPVTLCKQRTMHYITEPPALPVGPMLCRALGLCALCVLAGALPLPDLELVTYLPELVSIINELKPDINTNRDNDSTAGESQTRGPETSTDISQEDTQTLKTVTDEDSNAGVSQTHGPESTGDISQEDTQTLKPVIVEHSTAGVSQTHSPESTGDISQEDTQTLKPVIDEDSSAGVSQTHGPESTGDISQEDTQTFKPVIDEHSTAGVSQTHGPESTRDISQEDTQTLKPVIDEHSTAGISQTHSPEFTRNISQEDTQTLKPVIDEDSSAGESQTHSPESTRDISQEDTQTLKFFTALDVSTFDSVEEANEATG